MPLRWTVIIPIKALPQAKSRLVDATSDARRHAALVRAIRTDTITAASDAELVARVLVVADEPGVDGQPVLVQSRPGLNPALDEAARYATAQWPADGVAALVGDLPSLTPAELDEALAVAARYPRSFVPDAGATGTTLLTARPGTPLDPRFGAGSATRHASSAAILAAGDGLRTDVDTAEDLRRAEHLGLGPRTRAERSRQPSSC
ncbi:MAG: 2-phospho-L-lactate guanylyltransferase [Actinomycetota bacterium]